MINLKIDPEFQSQIPPLTDDEFKQLEENILQSLCTVIVGSLGEAVHISFGHFRLSGQDALL